MPDDIGLKLTASEREQLAMVLMGDYDLLRKIERTPLDREVDFSAAELDLLDDRLAIEVEHLRSCGTRKVLVQIRKRIALLMSL
ncbi:MAG: hypothetical protein FJ291_06395 [Planctomycetes bacterium]|nr:hypothetical protein [Planctomycetota bacterium]